MRFNKKMRFIGLFVRSGSMLGLCWFRLLCCLCRRLGSRNGGWAFGQEPKHLHMIVMSIPDTFPSGMIPRCTSHSCVYYVHVCLVDYSVAVYVSKWVNSAPRQVLGNSSLHVPDCGAYVCYSCSHIRVKCMYFFVMNIHF